MQIEADQQLAALQQQSRPSMQREWANAPMGSLRPAYGQHTNGQGSLDGHGSHDGVVMMSQNGSPMDDSPPDQSHVSVQVVSALILHLLSLCREWWLGHKALCSGIIHPRCFRFLSCVLTHVESAFSRGCDCMRLPALIAHMPDTYDQGSSSSRGVLVHVQVREYR